MSSVERPPAIRVLKIIIAITTCSLVSYGAAPEGWLLNGSMQWNYEAGVDSQAIYNGRPSAYLRYVAAAKPTSDDFGTLLQSFSAKIYSGHRVRFSAYIKATAVENWAGLWMRVDKGVGTARRTVSFDNMEDRPIKGTAGWQVYELVLDVPENSTLIGIGILLAGKGSVWLNSVNFEIVSKDVPLTSKPVPPLPDEPVNLNFDK